MRRYFAVGLALAFSFGSARGAPVSGTIVDDISGTPLENSYVLILGGRPPVFAPIRAGDDGTFQLGDIPAGGYTVVFGHKGFLYSAVSLSGTAGDQAIFIPARLERLGAIEGQLTGLQGRPARVLALIESRLSGVAAPVWKPVIDSTIDCCEAMPAARGVAVDENGVFRISDLPPGNYALLVSYGNAGLLRYPDGNGGFQLAANGGTLRVQIPVLFGAGHDIEGKIELPDSQSWYSIALSSPGQPALAVATTISGENGEFAFRGIMPGIYDVLAVPGFGERGKRSPVTKIYGGFARASVDIRESGAPDVSLKPQQGIRASFALQKSSPPVGAGLGCLITGLNLTPLEDWGVDLAREVEQVRIELDGAAVRPEPVDGLAPARYGITSHFGPCPVAGYPILDLSRKPTGDVEAKVNDAGIVRGRVVVPGDQPLALTAILVPDDFSEGLAMLPANWFRTPSAWSVENTQTRAPVYFPPGVMFGLLHGPAREGGYLPYIRIAMVEPDGLFEFGAVPAGRYRIALRMSGPAADSKDMKLIEVAPGRVAEIDLPAPSGR